MADELVDKPRSLLELAESWEAKANDLAWHGHYRSTWYGCAQELRRALACTPSAVRRMTPKQLDALRMLNDAFESHDGAPVMQAIITQADYRLLYEALAGGTTGDRIAQELLTPSAMTCSAPTKADIQKLEAICIAYRDSWVDLAEAWKALRA